nr:Human immunodeficiency virus type I [Haemonchus contortus]
MATGTRIQHVQHQRTGFPGAPSSAATVCNDSLESVEDKISRLISENEAIVQPNQTLLKRRPYHRQSIGQSSTDHDGSNVGEHGKWQFVEYKPYLPHISTLHLTRS